MPILSIKSATGQTQVIELFQGLNRIGRCSTNDHCIDDHSISSRHCEITVAPDSILVRDLDSTNGTFIDGQRVSQASLGFGQTLAIGQVETILEMSPARVAIPNFQAPLVDPFMADGSPVCYHHSGFPATMQCTQCEKSFCDTCVHEVRRVGGAALSLCPDCSGHCRRIVEETIETKPRSRFSLWLGKVTSRFIRV
jgi:hypothetical protein